MVCVCWCMHMGVYLVYVCCVLCVIGELYEVPESEYQPLLERCERLTQLEGHKVLASAMAVLDGRL